jgi:protein-S-isoprenylcysteine O-methyltransferase Ste14
MLNPHVKMGDRLFITMDRIPGYVYVLLVAGVVVWFLPFPLTGWSRKSPQTRDPRARWGILLEVAAYAIVWQGHFWRMPLPPWRLILSILFLVLANLLSWTSTRALGRYLRFEAALDADHQLVRSGPYRILRHPMYTSMLCLILGTGFVLAAPLIFAIAIVVFVIGTEIRVQIEDRLLGDRFGEEFCEYRRTTRAYIPLVR